MKNIQETTHKSIALHFIIIHFRVFFNVSFSSWEICRKIANSLLKRKMIFNRYTYDEVLRIFYDCIRWFIRSKLFVTIYSNECTFYSRYVFIHHHWFDMQSFNGNAWVGRIVHSDYFFCFFFPIEIALFFLTQFYQLDVALNTLIL